MFAKLFILFITVPLIELFLFLLVGQRIGIGATFGLVLLTGLLGATLARSQGLRALTRYREALAQGRLPHDAVIDGLLILVAGALLLTPGFLTDTIGFLLLVPQGRTLVRERIESSLKRKLTPGASRTTASRNAPQDVITVDAEVIDERRA